MLSTIFSFGTDQIAITMSDAFSVLATWMKESGLWIFEVLKNWALLLLSDWFEYIFGAINTSNFPLLSQLAGWILVINGWFPLDFGFQLFFAYWTVAVPVSVMRLVFKVIPFIG